MAQFAVPVAIASLAASVGSSIYTGLSAADAQDKQNAANAKAQADADAQIALQKAQSDKQDKALADAQAQADNQATRANQLSRQRAQQLGTVGRSSTILTSPLGIPSQPTMPGKSILGG